MAAMSRSWTDTKYSWARAGRALRKMARILTRNNGGCEMVFDGGKVLNKRIKVLALALAGSAVAAQGYAAAAAAAPATAGSAPAAANKPASAHKMPSTGIDRVGGHPNFSGVWSVMNT